MALTQEQILQIRKQIGLPESGVGEVNQNISRRQQLAEQFDAQQKKQGFFSAVGEDLKSRGQDIGQTLKKTAAGEINPLETGIRTVGAVAGGVGDVLGRGIIGVGKAILPKSAEEKVASGVSDIAGSGLVQNVADSYKNWKEKHPRIAKDLEATVNIASIFPIGGGSTIAGKAAKTGVVKAAKTVEEGITTIAKTEKDLVKSIAKKVPEYTDNAIKWLASEPNSQVKTILKETPSSKFDEYISVAKKASIDPREKSVFETVGEKLTEATKQIKKQTNSIGEQKSKIINQAKIGLQEFKDFPRKAVIEVMKLDDNPLKNNIISKLKSIKTKFDADKAIDDIQSMLYDATGTKLIAQGSKIEKQIKSIVGKLNTELKNSLSKAYANLNAKFAERTKILNTLNRALGEVVEGVPIRGASLIKQFFSPAGSKTKELFDYIKKTTGIDLAQETTLAKFAGEIFNDPKIKSLLEGIPSGRQGLIEQGIGFVAEKTGLGEKVREIIKKGKIEKARSLTPIPLPQRELLK